MTTTAHLALGDELDLTLYPRAGVVKLYGDDRETPAAIWHTPYPVVLRTGAVCPDPSAHRAPRGLRRNFGLALSRVASYLSDRRR